MSDIVKRLRTVFAPGAHKVMDEAADRIERLEAFVAKVRAARVEESDLFDAHYDPDALDQALADLDSDSQIK